MATPATVQQIQNFSDQRIRPRAQQIAALAVNIAADLAEIGDVYAALTGAQSGWVDGRTDGPPHLATASDILAMNTFLTDILAAITGDTQYPICRNLLINSPNAS